MRLTINEASQVAAVGDAVFVRGGGGELLHVTETESRKMGTPGPCDAIARTSTGKLMAAFTGAGIFAFDEGWTRMFDYPSGAGKGKHVATLTEDNGTVVFTTESLLDPSPERIDGLWVSAGDKLVRIDLLK